MRRALKLSLVAVAVVVVISGIRLVQGNGVAAEPTAKAAEASAKYHCPMHPSYVSDKPGSCPICGMKLVSMGDDTATHGPAPHTGHDAAPSPVDRASVTLTLAHSEQADLVVPYRRFVRSTYDAYHLGRLLWILDREKHVVRRRPRPADTAAVQTLAIAFLSVRDPDFPLALSEGEVTGAGGVRPGDARPAE